MGFLIVRARGEVRQQLACTAARLGGEQAMPIINANIIRDIDHEDPYLPMLWWWAVERFRRNLAPTHPLSYKVLAAWKLEPENLILHRFAISLGHPEPVAEAKREAFDRNVAPNRRAAMLSALGLTPDSALVEPLLDLISTDSDIALRSEALQLLARYEHPAIAPRFLQLHPSPTPATLQSQIRDILRIGTHGDGGSGWRRGPSGRNPVGAGRHARRTARRGAKAKQRFARGHG